MEIQGKRIEVNALGWSIDCFSKEFDSSFLKAYQKILDGKVKWVINPHENLYEGRRFLDAERNLTCTKHGVCSSFSPRGFIEIDNVDPTEIVEWISKLTEEDFDKLAMLSANYSASCDHWYTFEKEW